MLIFACSGAADVGEVADQAARQLTREGVGKMYCLAGVGGRVSSIVETTQAAAGILAIDGCPLECARSALEQVGIAEYAHLRLADLGMKKGHTPANEANVAQVVERGKALLG
jgi:uncharacterized metal-binding protein